MVGPKYTFKMTSEEYKKYEQWCKDNHLDGYAGACGGNTAFEIVPTSLGDIVTAFAQVVVRDELGEVSYDKNGKPKKKRIECIIRDIQYAPLAQLARALDS